MRHLAVVGLALSAVAGAFGAESPDLGFDDHPLAPPDTSSPRATLETFTTAVDKAWELREAGDLEFQRYADAARRCLDVSEVPPNLLASRTLDAALLLKEVLDRLELPPARAIPGREEVVAEELTSWTIPHTEIDLVLMTSGPRQGEFLFSAETVERSREYFERVHHLPYQPGKSGAKYDALRLDIESRLVADLVSILPQWMRNEYGGQLGWQWVALALLILLAIALVILAIAVGRRLSRSDRRLASLAGALLPPLVLMSLGWIVGPLAPWRTELGGPGVWVISMAFRVATYIGAAWLAAAIITRAAHLIIRLSGADEQPLRRQLILVSSRVLALIAIAVVFFKGGQSLGIPLSALVTGLGVGGLAVALAAQSTLENLIGGINLFADRPVRIGDICRFGGQMGIVEAIGLRSTRIRTLARTVVSIPNSTFARMELENLSLRDRNLLRTQLRIEQGTGPARVEEVLEALREALSSDDRVAPEPFRVHLLELGPDALQIEIYLYLLTEDWNEYLAWREDLLLLAMRVVDEAGLRLAPPTTRHEVVREAGDTGG